MKTIAIITPSERDFNHYVLQQKQTDQETKFIRIWCLNQCYELQISGYLSITNAGKMSGLNNIVKELEKRVIK